MKLLDPIPILTKVINYKTKPRLHLNSSHRAYPCGFADCFELSPTTCNSRFHKLLNFRLRPRRLWNVCAVLAAALMRALSFLKKLLATLMRDHFITILGSRFKN